MATTEKTHIEGPAGALQLLVEMPQVEPVGIAVICHPHPQFGGNLDNKVVWSLARAALGHGFVAVRFNYRGVGESAGSYADGVGETDDARAVIAWAQTRWSDRALWLLGFSFGAAVALRIAASQAAAALVTVAPPLTYFEQDSLPQPRCPWLLLHGDADDVVPWPQTRQCLAALPVQPDVQVFAGVGHFFHGELVTLRERVDAWLAQRV